MFICVCACVCVCVYVIQGYKSVPNSFSTNSGPIFLENLACSGLEQNLIECPHSTIGTHQCDHSRDAAVQCYGRLDIVIRNKKTTLFVPMVNHNHYCLGLFVTMC